MQFSQCVPSALLHGIAVAVLIPGMSALGNAKPNPSTPSAVWSAPSAVTVENAILEWLVQSADTERQAQVREVAVRPALEGLYGDADRLDQVVKALAVGSPAIARVVSACNESPLEVGSLDWLDSEEIPYWMRANVRLYVGRELVRVQYYEQALDTLTGIGVTDVFDPAGLLFYRAVAEHQLVRVDEANETLALLLDAEQPLPERFVQVARLMKADIANVKTDSLDHIARRMSDVHRRLDLGEANQKAQEVERGILASLDKMINKLEEQRKQQQQQQQASGGSPSNQPMEDSRIAEQKGEGKVDIKDIGDQAGWGDLSPRERERVLQQIGREFPGHYRDLMEEYLKRLATDEREEQEP